MCRRRRAAGGGSARLVWSAVAVDLVCWTSVTNARVLASDSVGSAESSDHVEVLWATVISFDRGRQRLASRGDSVGPDSYWKSDSAADSD